MPTTIGFVLLALLAVAVVFAVSMQRLRGHGKLGRRKGDAGSAATGDGASGDRGVRDYGDHDAGSAGDGGGGGGGD